MKLITPKFWQKRTFLSLLLLPLSFIYGAIVGRYRKKLLYVPKAHVITVGNITLGGAGKTPIVISLTKILKGKIAVLTRGYLGELKGPVMVKATHNILDVGDEALLLSKYVPTCVAKDRLEGIKFLESQDYEIIITDDGLQDGRFSKALTILVVDSYFGFGNGFVFPSGPLRENLSSGLKKADMIVLIGSRDYALTTDKPIMRAKLMSEQNLNGQKFIAFAGIGNPEKFFQSVTEFGGEVIKNIAFADHHQYTDVELEKLIELAREYQAELITTEKDYVRIDSKFRNKIQVLPVSLSWRDEQFVMKEISKYLGDIL